MKLAITTTLAMLTLVAGSAARAADAVLVSASPAPARLSLDQKATNACFNAFVAQLLPGNSTRIRTVMAAGSASIFTSLDDSLLAPYKLMDVEMSATKAQGGELLAKSLCRVNRNAKVLQLETHVTDAARLSGLALKDIKLAMTNR